MPLKMHYVEFISHFYSKQMTLHKYAKVQKQI